MPNEKIAETLKQLRKSTGKTGEEVANEMGISRSALANYESGARSPKDSIKEKIASYYGKSVGEVFYEQLCESKEKDKCMKVEEAVVDHVAMLLINDITAFAYDSIGDKPEDKLLRDAYLYSIQGIVEFANKLKEVLKE